jgi:hypothetical protein
MVPFIAPHRRRRRRSPSGRQPVARSRNEAAARQPDALARWSARPPTAPGADDCGDPGSNLGRGLMLPRSHHCPSGCRELLVGIFVACAVGGDLRRPVPDVRSGTWIAMLGAAVPKAPVDVHRDTNPAKDNVRSASQSRDRAPIHPVPQSHSVQERALQLHAAADAGRDRVRPVGAGLSTRPSREPRTADSVSHCR